MVEFFVEEGTPDDSKPEGILVPGDENIPQDGEAPTDAKEPKGKAPEGDTPDSVEELAGEIGWRPDGELSAKDYILKSRDIQDTMRTHIQDQKKQVTELSSSVAELKTHNEKVYKAEVSKLEAEIVDLKKEKREAIEDGDADRVDKLDEQIDGIKEVIATPQAETKSAVDEDPVLTQWLGENSWYDTNPEMAQYANAVAAENPGAPYERVLALASRKVKEMFPDQFEGGGRAPAPGAPAPRAKTPASPVEGAGKRAAAATFTKADLSQDQLNIMSQFVRQDIMTEEQYIADIAKTQGV